MTEIDDTIKMYKQLCKEHQELVENHGDFFEIKNLESEILKCERQLRNLGVDF